MNVKHADIRATVREGDHRGEPIRYNVSDGMINVGRIYINVTDGTIIGGHDPKVTLVTVY